MKLIRRASDLCRFILWRRLRRSLSRRNKLMMNLTTASICDEKLGFLSRTKIRDQIVSERSFEKSSLFSELDRRTYLYALSVSLGFFVWICLRVWCSPFSPRALGSEPVRFHLFGAVSTRGACCSVVRRKSGTRRLENHLNGKLHQKNGRNANETRGAQADERRASLSLFLPLTIPETSPTSLDCHNHCFKYERKFPDATNFHSTARTAGSWKSSLCEFEPIQS